ncbi:MAG: toll/interleukin-1 receptor domain-containing protein [Candidatus Competibacteraceae bacterium]
MITSNDLDYQFFFSYARQDYENAEFRYPNGTTGNYLKQFYEDICKWVCDNTGINREKVSYFDQARLEISVNWHKELVKSLNNSRVLLAILSPHCLKSKACGKEFQFFMNRFEEFKKESSDGKCHRIIPVFWMDSTICLKKILDNSIREFIEKLQWNQKEMHPDYPITVGLKQIRALAKEPDEYNRLVIEFAKRIVEIAEMKPELHKLEVNNNSFDTLKSAFHSEERSKEESKVLKANTANVMYIIGEKKEMLESSAKCDNIDAYDDCPEAWKPFSDTPKTVEMATQGSLIMEGYKYNKLGLTKNLSVTIFDQVNPILMVFDRCAINLPKLKNYMHEYDEKNDLDHIGLVTAGGKAVDDASLKELFINKYNKECHIWRVPENRQDYVNNVLDVVAQLGFRLKRNIIRNKPITGAPLPGL